MMRRRFDMSGARDTNGKTRTGPELPEPIPRFENFGHVTLRGARNTRDLGALSTADDRTIAAGRLIRSGDLHKCTDEDIELLRDGHGLIRVVDFRTAKERGGAPDPQSRMQGIDFAELPVFSEAAVGITHEGGIAGDIAALKRFSGNAHETIRGLYVTCLLGEDGKRAYREFFETLLAAEDGATLWHCTEGKDRAGLASVLVEYALGVPMPHIRADYLATNLFVRDAAEEILDALAGHGLLEHVDLDVDSIFYADMDYLDAALEAVEQECGGMDAYLAAVLGVGELERERLRELYLQ